MRGRACADNQTNSAVQLDAIVAAGRAVRHLRAPASDCQKTLDTRFRREQTHPGRSGYKLATVSNFGIDCAKKAVLASNSLVRG